MYFLNRNHEITSLLSKDGLVFCSNMSKQENEGKENKRFFFLVAQDKGMKIKKAGTFLEEKLSAAKHKIKELLLKKKRI